MIIRLCGPEPSPNILFTLTYPEVEFTDKFPCPASWLMQMNMVRACEDEGFNMDMPQQIHVLDKAAWHSVVISELSFDIVDRKVKCTFIDKSMVEWSLSTTGIDAACVAALRSVITDVQGASEHIQREQSAFLPGPSSAPQPPCPAPVSSNPSKHKRQKSLFSSIVAAVKGALSDNANRGPTLPTSLPPLKIPSHSSHHCRTTSTFSRTQRSPPASPVVSEPPPPPPRPVFQLQVRPRPPIPPPPYAKNRTPSEQLKHRARSSLVDIVRRYVYPAFSLTGSPSFAEVQSAPEWIAQTYGFPPGQFPAWALKSLLRKAEEQMRNMMSEANAHGIGQALDAAYRHRQAATPMLEQDDEDDTTSASTSASATSVSTETDGSSVHTPTDSPVRSPFAPGIASPRYDLPRLSPLETKMLPQVPRSPSPPSPTFDFDISTYHALGAMRTRILSMLTTMDSSPRQILSGPRHGTDLTILEIKSRRRAWSARDYVGGARLSLLGLATPFRSSPLARCEPVTAETVARMQAQATRESERASLIVNRSFVGLGDLSAEFGVTVGVKAVTKEMDSRLFPLSEEEEEEGEFESSSAPEYQSGYSLDEYVEDEGWRDMREFDLESGLLAFPRPDPPSAPPVYSHMHPMVRTRTTSMRREHPRLPPGSLVQQRGQGGLSADSLLCQPLNVKVPVPVMLDSSDPFAEDDYTRSGEFTLSMDLPPPPRGWYNQEKTVR